MGTPPPTAPIASYVLDAFAIVAYLRDEPGAEAVAQVKGYPMTLVGDCAEEFLLAAAGLKAAHPISYADAFAVALATREGATLVTGDPELKPLGAAGVVRLSWIGLP